MALVYELKGLEKFIDRTLHPKNHIEILSDKNKVPEWREFIFSETERIIGCFTETVYNSKERQREIFFLHHQKSLIRLADKVYHYLLPKDPQSIYQLSTGDEVVNFYKEVFQCIEELLYFIEQNFKDYYNQEENVTEVYLLITQQGLKSKLKVLQLKFNKQKADTNLVKIALAPIIQFCRKQKVSYRQLLYVKNLADELSVLQAGPSKMLNGELNKTIIRLMVYLNFNNGDFISYCLTNIVDVINIIPEQKERIARLLQFRKEYNQMQVKPGVMLKLNCDTLKEQVSKWITEEIHYLDTKQRLLSVAPVIKDDQLLSDEERLHFSVSVHVLGILGRAAHDSKLILNKHGTTVFKNISKYCRTIQAKNRVRRVWTRSRMKPNAAIRRKQYWCCKK